MKYIPYNFSQLEYSKAKFCVNFNNLFRKVQVQNNSRCIDDIFKNCSFSEQFGLTTADYYYYLNQSGCYEVDGVNDVKEYQDTRVCQN